jgi:hypothetical protein
MAIELISATLSKIKLYSSNIQLWKKLYFKLVLLTMVLTIYQIKHMQCISFDNLGLMAVVVELGLINVAHNSAISKPTPKHTRCDHG